MKRVTYDQLRQNAKGCFSCKRKPVHNNKTLLKFLRNEDSPFPRQLSATAKSELLNAERHGHWFCFVCFALKIQEREGEGAFKTRQQKHAAEIKEKLKRGKCAMCGRGVNKQNEVAFTFQRTDSSKGPSIWCLVENESKENVICSEMEKCILIDRECAYKKRHTKSNIHVRLVL